eukprot:CAMPEP_0170402738 /NCGR_PEP_ID=MMETSP0117_2-20130122/25722_1 /TAXON_ID=400756 /ORGANISM="Durinskia baltica, Strain CSIRO CS-38" /LENGTH=66 /DNA_ID=CAMNT_0010659635 /DNA_START=120 /DNA_END=317 /DNA_ORIENTATION=+
MVRHTCGVRHHVRKTGTSGKANRNRWAYGSPVALGKGCAHLAHLRPRPRRAVIEASVNRSIEDSQS